VLPTKTAFLDIISLTFRDAAEDSAARGDRIFYKKWSRDVSPVQRGEGKPKEEEWKNNQILCNTASYGKLPVSSLNAKVVTVSRTIASFLHIHAYIQYW